MGLLDSIAGSVLGKLGGEQGNMAQVAMDLFNQNGGLNGILEKFRENGLGETAASWVGNGGNISITAEQISSVLGNGAIADMAAKFGINAETLSAQIAEHLPTLVDKLTPNGEAPAESGNLLSTVLGMLR
ncbi:YidB family protein [Methylotenera versatilis]|uniref:YidB family protein n=1 Tax=Methylotenera versatilis TaxID=1055487 RepID=UPI000648984A|nr:YidB family protein [Methylotenera versatilis]